MKQKQLKIDKPKYQTKNIKKKLKESQSYYGQYIILTIIVLFELGFIISCIFFLTHTSKG